MGARSEVHRVDHPFPVVFDALRRALPTKGFRIVEDDPTTGTLRLRTANARLTVAVGAVDAITSEWQASSEQRIGLFRPRHERHFAEIGDALDQYLDAYYA